MIHHSVKNMKPLNTPNTKDLCFVRSTINSYVNDCYNLTENVNETDSEGNNLSLRKISKSYKKLAKRVSFFLTLIAAVFILNHPSIPNIVAYRIVLLVALIAALLFSPYWILVVYRLNKKNRSKSPSWLQQRRLRSAGFNDIDKMSGVELEDCMYVYFRNIGWKAEKTPVSGDYGADLILTDPAGKRIAAQLKRYSGQVGVDAVQEIAAAHSQAV